MSFKCGVHAGFEPLLSEHRGLVNFIAIAQPVYPFAGSTPSRCALTGLSFKGTGVGGTRGEEGAVGLLFLVNERFLRFGGRWEGFICGAKLLFPFKARPLPLGRYVKRSKYFCNSRLGSLRLRKREYYLGDPLRYFLQRVGGKSLPCPSIRANFHFWSSCSQEGRIRPCPGCIFLGDFKRRGSE